jgi:hypothetical protein
VPRGLTAVRLSLAGICLATFAIVYLMARPTAQGAGEVGSQPVRAVGEQTFETPRLGRAAKLPPLAPTRTAPVPVAAPAPVRRETTDAAVPEPPEPPSPARAASTSGAPSAPVTEAAPPTPPPAPAYAPPPAYAPQPAPEPVRETAPQPPAPAPAQDPVTFDDSG